MSKTRASVTVHGRVQGVCFRMYTCEQAGRLGLRGWVRNTFERTVEAVFEGEEADVRAMVEWCHRGPSAARVTRVDVEYSDPTGEFSGFQVTG